jgi:hypothetical protein
MIAKGVHSLDFELEPSKGEATLGTFLYTGNNEVVGVSFTEVELL